jgi:hypothetical protein
MFSPSMQKWKAHQRLLPTPRAADARKGIRTPEGAAKERLRRKNGEDLPSFLGGRASPLFLEWVMGYPGKWSELPRSEMPSSRKSSRSSVEPS